MAQNNRILIADDNEANVELLDAFLSEIDCETQVAVDGQDTLDKVTAFKPDLILLDLNMPVMHGRELLQRIRLEPSLCDIPIVILTTSNQESDILRSYELGCNSFITKPVSLDGFAKAIRDLGRYWFELVTLPPH